MNKLVIFALSFLYFSKKKENTIEIQLSDINDLNNAYNNQAHVSFNEKEKNVMNIAEPMCIFIEWEYDSNLDIKELTEIQEFIKAVHDKGYNMLYIETIISSDLYNENQNTEHLSKCENYIKHYYTITMGQSLNNMEISSRKISTSKTKDYTDQHGGLYLHGIYHDDSPVTKKSFRK